MPNISIHRKSHFNAAHRLFNKRWDQQKNTEVFGKCANPHYHGHNYELIVTVNGEINQETGFVINLDLLKKIIENEVEDYLDHKNLNEQIDEFKILNPTVENIAVVIWNRLKNKLESELKLEVTLYETSRNFATYKGN